MVKAIRNIELALGDGIKNQVKVRKNINIARKSILAKRDIEKGDIFFQKKI